MRDDAAAFVLAALLLAEALQHPMPHYLLKPLFSTETETTSSQLLVLHT
ncbi:hypothetical protein [Terribacillus aidingensis]|nr:hypothetical protein [Terribacillus aidingensis]